MDELIAIVKKREIDIAGKQPQYVVGRTYLIHPEFLILNPQIFISLGA